MPSVIFHIDMDSFFVSCERSKNESLKNKPVVIATNQKRAIISAMSYEVKQHGFKTGDPFYLVKEKIKNLIVVEPHYQLYSLMSKKIFNFIRDKFSQNLEIYSIDECYIDVTTKVKQFKSPIELAKIIQKSILDIFKIPCSIGISYTKFLAKMSTNNAKPFGILETKKEDIINNFYKLPIKKIFGIGNSSATKLKEINVLTYKDLVNCKNDLFLKKVFGKNYYKLIEDLKGTNVSKQHILPKDIKSISNSKTFMDSDKDDVYYLIDELKKIALNISKRAKDQNLVGKVVSLSLRLQNKIWIHKHKKIDGYTNEFDIIWKNIKFLFSQMWDDNKIRGLGIAISDLKSTFNIQKSLDLFKNSSSMNKVEKIIKENNFYEGKEILKTLKQFSKEKNINIENIKFLRKNTTIGTKKINLEE
ncbi:Y-family DNA polymerase [Metamycoplasma gateae]|uniref:DNA polymerase IV n=1 Tax=Metamycoplasma gateae TaxID=35769 RepID=A0ABZ2AGH8_9BACT|nr:DNA polymerase IV [Metamycoplasma gateae]